MSELRNLNFINFMHGTCCTRVYKLKNSIYSYTVTREELQPYETTSIRNMAEYLDETINGSWGLVDLQFGYARGSLTKNKRKKLSKLLEEQGQIDTDRMIRWITLLI